MQHPRSLLAVTLVALALGLLLVVQFRTQSVGSGMGELSAQDLTLLVANLNTRNDLLRAEVGDLQRQLGALQTGAATGETSAGQLRLDLARIRSWSGLAPASGPGVQIVISGPLPGAAIEDLLNELRNAGAEAIAVDDVRVVTGTVVAGDPGALSVENTPLGDTFTIVAIGHPETLTGSLTRAGGIVSLLAATYPGASVTVAPRDDLQLTATDRDLQPAHGSPHV